MAEGLEGESVCVCAHVCARGELKREKSSVRFPSGVPPVLTGVVVGVPLGSSPAIMRY